MSHFHATGFYMVGILAESPADEIHGVALVSGVLSGQGSLLGMTDGVAFLECRVTLIGSDVLESLVEGIADVAGVLQGAGILAGVTDGVALVGATSNGSISAVGVTDGVALVAGIIIAEGRLLGSTDGVAYVEVISYGEGVLTGVTDGVTFLDGELSGFANRMAGVSDGVAILVEGTLQAQGALIGMTDGVAALTGVLVGKGKLYGSSEGIANLEASMLAAVFLQGASDGIANVSSAVLGSGRLYGSADGVAFIEVRMTLINSGEAKGLIEGVADVSGGFSAGSVIGELTGVIAAEDLIYGNLTVDSFILSGSSAGIANVTGNIPTENQLNGEIMCIAELIALIRGKGRLVGRTDGVALVGAGTVAEGVLRGQANGVVVISGSLEPLYIAIVQMVTQPWYYGVSAGLYVNRIGIVVQISQRYADARWPYADSDGTSYENLTRRAYWVDDGALYEDFGTSNFSLNLNIVNRPQLMFPVTEMVGGCPFDHPSHDESQGIYLAFFTSSYFSSMNPDIYKAPGGSAWLTVCDVIPVGSIIPSISVDTNLLEFNQTVAMGEDHFHITDSTSSGWFLIVGEQTWFTCSKYWGYGNEEIEITIINENYVGDILVYNLTTRNPMTVTITSYGEGYHPEWLGYLRWEYDYEEAAVIHFLVTNDSPTNTDGPQTLEWQTRNEYGTPLESGTVSMVSSLNPLDSASLFDDYYIPYTSIHGRVAGGDWVELFKV